MKHSHGILLCLIITVCVSFVVTERLWSDYLAETQARENDMFARGETLVSFFEVGIKTHRRVGGWIVSSLGGILDDLAGSPGVKALALYGADGKIIQCSSGMPDGLVPVAGAQWTTHGLLACKRTQFAEIGGPGMRGMGGLGGRGMGPGFSASDLPEPDVGKILRELAERRSESLGKPPPPGPEAGEIPPPHMRGDPQREHGPGRSGRFAPLAPEDEDHRQLENEVWFAALIDAEPYHIAILKERREFIVSLAASWAAMLFGLALIGMIFRQGRLAAELGLAREREGRLEELARLGAGLAHETKNPLSLIRGVAQSWLGRSTATDEERIQARQIVDESDRVVGRVNSFLRYARPPQPSDETFDLGEVLSSTGSLFLDEANAKGITLDVVAQKALVSGDSGMMRQVLVNLLANALGACKKGDTVSASLVRANDKTWRVQIRDSGSGMSPDDLAQATKPYFTLHESGTGLGLAIVDQIAKAHGWRLVLESEKGQGTTARIEGIEGAATGE